MLIVDGLEQVEQKHNPERRLNASCRMLFLWNICRIFLQWQQ